MLRPELVFLAAAGAGIGGRRQPDARMSDAIEKKSCLIASAGYRIGANQKIGNVALPQQAIRLCCQWTAAAALSESVTGSEAAAVTAPACSHARDRHQIDDLDEAFRHHEMGMSL